MSAETEVRRSLGHIFSTALIFRLASILLSTLLANFLQLGWHGIHSINLNLYISLTSWSRNECIRRVLQRFPPSKNGQDKKINCQLDTKINDQLQRINFLVTLVSIACCTFLWLKFPPALVTRQASTQVAYTCAILLHMIAALITAMADPFYMQICYDEKYLVHARLETMGTCVFSCIYVVPNILIAIVYGQEWTPISCLILSGLGQCGWAINLLITSARANNITLSGVVHRLVSLISFENSTELTEPIKENLKLEIFTSVQKMILTEGDKFLILRYIEDEAKGAISIIMSIGGIITRVFFLGQEEIINIHYSRHSLRNEENLPKTFTSWLSYFDVLTIVSSTQIYLGLAILIFGPSASTAILRCIYGRRMLEHAYLLAGYCLVLFLIAINGVLEGFFNSAADLKWLKRNRIFQVACWFAITLAGALGMMSIRDHRKAAEIWLVVTGLYFFSRLVVPIIMLRVITRPWTNKLMQHYGTQSWPTVLTLLLIAGAMKFLPTKISILERPFQRFPLSLRERIFNTECFYYFILGMVILFTVHKRLHAWRVSGGKSKI